MIDMFGPYQLTKSLRELTHELEDMLDALKVESERDDIEIDERWGAPGPLSTSRHAYGAYKKGHGPR